MRSVRYMLGASAGILVVAMFASISANGDPGTYSHDGKRLFERETFDGNGRTCSTCHTSATGTVSPSDARKRFKANRHDPLFLHDGSDDGHGNGISRMLSDATVLVEVPLPPNVTLADDPAAHRRAGLPRTRR